MPLSINPEQTMGFSPWCAEWVDFRYFVFFYLCLTGCSRQAKDKFLRTFFDGVPPIKENVPAVNSKVTADKDAQQEKNNVPPATEKLPEAKKSQVVFHVPYFEKQCDSCHDTKFSQKLVSAPKELCFTCHDDFTKDKKVIHYPVSDGACIECHDPHQSPNKALLKKSMPEVCYSCHDEKDIKANPMHEGQAVCSECHNPHASNEEKLLK